MRVVACLNCESVRYTEYGRVSASEKGLHRRYVRCADCGLVYANPQAEEEQIAKFYALSYYDGIDLGYLKRKGYQRFLEARLRTIRRFAHGLRVLDIGCGSGALLARLQTRGYEVVGIEPGSVTAAEDLSVRGVRIVRGAFPNAVLEGRQFDVVYSWHVIEHVSEPVGFLRAVKESLAPGGVAIIGTESIGWRVRFERVLSRIRGREMPVVTSSEHTIFPTISVLRSMAQRAGLRVLRWRVYDDAAKGHVLAIKAGWHDLLRWPVQAVAYVGSAVLNRGGPKCEIVLAAPDGEVEG